MALVEPLTLSNFGSLLCIVYLRILSAKSRQKVSLANR